MRKSITSTCCAAAFFALALGTAASASADTAVPASIPAVSATTAAATGTIVVDGSIGITLNTGDTSFALHGLAGAANSALPDNSISYTVTTNNIGGYTVALKPTTLNMTPADTSANKDVIPFSAVDIAASKISTPDPVLVGQLPALATTGIATPTPLLQAGNTVYSQTYRSIPAGDSHTVTFDANIPFVNSGAYSGTMTFTATAN